MGASFVRSRLDELDGDTQITNPVAGQVTRHNGSKWVNSQLAHADLSGIGSNSHAQIDSHIASTSSPHGATLTQQNLTITGTLDINNTAPAFTLTDTTPSAKSLKIDVDADIAQIREKVGAVNSLLSFNLNNNRIGVFTAPAADGGNGVFLIQRTLSATDPITLFRVDPTNATNASVYAVSGTARAGYGNAPFAMGLSFSVWTINSGTATDARCLNLDIGAWGGAITRAHTIFIANPGGSAAITDAIAVRVARQTKGSSKNYGFYYGADGVGSEPAGNFAVYADLDKSYFGAPVGIGNISPASTALLDIASTTKGVLIPRMTAVQRDAITSPAAGLLVYNTDTNQFNYWNGSAWTIL